MSLATMLSNKHEVCVLDIDESRVQAINDRKSTIRDNDIDEMLKKMISDSLQQKIRMRHMIIQILLLFVLQQTLMNLHIFLTQV